MTAYETRQAAVAAYDAWAADNKGCKFFQDYVVEVGLTYEVQDKAIELIWSGTFK